MSAPPATSAGPTADAEPSAKDAGTGLTFPQIAAGALAAATASILGSFLGVLGTIGGAAAASVVSTIGAALYQRSLERTRDRVKERLVVNPTGNQVAAAVARVTGQGRPGAPVRGGRAYAPGAPGAPTRAVPGAPGPGRPGAPLPPGAFGPGPTQAVPRRGPDGRPLPPEQQLRAGGRTVATQVHAQGAPTRDAPGRPRPGVIPSARTTGTPPGGMPPPTQRMPGAGGPGDGDAATQLVHIGPDEGVARPKRFGKRTWFTLAGVAASVFVIGILASIGVETATGRPLSGGTSGTSVGSVFGQNTEAPATSEAPTETSAPSGDESATSTPAERSGSGSSESTGQSGQDGSSERTSQQRSPSNSERGSGDGGGGLLPTGVLPRFGGDSSTNG